jgi:hypothetical protein
MLMAAIEMRSSGDRSPRNLTLEIGNRYGMTGDIAHEVLLLCVLGADKPVVVDRKDRMYRLARTRVSAVVVWARGRRR